MSPVHGKGRLVGRELVVELRVPVPVPVLPGHEPPPVEMQQPDGSPALPLPHAGGPAHAPGFATVNWRGQVYSFTPKQRAVVSVLWAAWKDGCPWVGADALLKAADSDSDRLRDVFDHGRHPAWGSLIVQGQLDGGPVGTYRLAAG